MALFLVTAPASEPLTVEEAKLHLRITSDDESALIDGLIVAAREYVESFTRRRLITQTWDLKLDVFPASGCPIELPGPPLASVSSVTYTDTDGVSQTWSSGDYTVDVPSGPWARHGRIFLNYQEVYPTTRIIENAVTIRFVCGYGQADSVPSSIKAAMKILIGTWFQPGRQSVQIGNIVTRIPDTVDALLWPFKAF